ncbi:hypothetical protein [Corynebacterium nuruki]|uniref:hypothetical protein n=1 Tax=Corynebacterium nuruki TaxID=1032851 RepID=UPI0039BF7CB7
MRYKYWTIQARPDATRLLSYGIGVLVVEDETQRATLKMFTRHQALPVPSEADEAVRNAISFLQRQFKTIDSQQGGLRLAGVETPSSFADRLVHHWSNLITVDPARYLAAGSLNEATELLFGMFIGTPARMRATAPIYRLRNTVRDAYSAHPEIGSALRRAPELQAGSIDGGVDLAVVGEGDKVVELNQSFSFLQSSPSETKKTITAWNYGIDKLRARGGTLTTTMSGDPASGERQLSLPTDAPVVVTYDPPESAKQQDLFSRMSGQWKELDITAVPRSRIKAHANQLVTRLRSA